MLQLHLLHSCDMKAAESKVAASVTLLHFGLCPVTIQALFEHDCHMTAKHSACGNV